MNKRAKEIKKRLERRKRMKLEKMTWKNNVNKQSNHHFHNDDEMIHPLFNKEILQFKILLAIITFLSVGILFKNQTVQLQPAREFVHQAFEKDFEFATVASWYEDKFGKPLALWPKKEHIVADEATTQDAKNMGYAVPASGTVLKYFEADGRGLMIETGGNSNVDAVKEGFVVFIGKKDDIGKTVIIQHAGGGETWYGNLDDINVKLYDYVDSGTALGSVSQSENGTSGKFYFAIKQGDSFIDPIQVMSFE